MSKFVFNAACYAVCVRMLSFVTEALKGLDGKVRVDLTGLSGRLAERVLEEMAQAPRSSKAKDAEDLANFVESICDQTQALSVKLRSPMRPVEDAVGPLQAKFGFSPALQPYGSGESPLAAATRMVTFNLRRTRDAMGALLVLAELAGATRGTPNPELTERIDSAREALTKDEQSYEFRQLKLALIAGNEAELTALRNQVVASEFSESNGFSHYFTIGGRLPNLSSLEFEATFRKEVQQAAARQELGQGTNSMAAA